MKMLRPHTARKASAKPAQRPGSTGGQRGGFEKTLEQYNANMPQSSLTDEEKRRELVAIANRKKAA